jgi:hypothetical protein
MRALVSIFVIVVVVAIVAVATGFINLHGSAGVMPRVAIEGGKAPSVAADVGSIDLGTKNSSVEVPKVDVGTVTKTVQTPTIAVRKAD